jgi:solute carrier family 25 citrate transporter 1
MQSLEARAQYRNSFHCAYRIFTEEGILRFWTGTTPRLARLVVSLLEFYRFQDVIADDGSCTLQLSGGIVFTVYENIIKVIGGRES